MNSNSSSFNTIDDNVSSPTYKVLVNRARLLIENLNGPMLFLVLAVFRLGIDYGFQRYILTQDFYQRNLGDQMSVGQIEDLFTRGLKMMFLIYPFQVLLLFIKCFLMACILQAGLYFNKIETSFGTLLKITVLSNFILLVPEIIRLLWFCFLDQNYDADDLSFFYPLSALSLFREYQLSTMWMYPLKIINFFEVLYCMSLGLFLSAITRKSYEQSLSTVLGSYLPLLLIWIVTVMFIFSTFSSSAR